MMHGTRQAYCVRSCRINYCSVASFYCACHAWCRDAAVAESWHDRWELEGRNFLWHCQHLACSNCSSLCSAVLPGLCSQPHHAHGFVWAVSTDCCELLMHALLACGGLCESWLLPAHSVSLPSHLHATCRDPILFKGLESCLKQS